MSRHHLAAHFVPLSFLFALGLAGGRGTLDEVEAPLNAGTEGEATVLYDVFENTNNVYGLVGSSKHVHYLGTQESHHACAFAAAHFFLSSGGSQQMSSYAWHPPDYASEQWRGLCFGNSLIFANWSPTRQKGVMSGRLRPRRWRRWLSRLNQEQRALLASSKAARAAEKKENAAQSTSGDWEGEEGGEGKEGGGHALRGGGAGAGERGARQCNVLEWRLAGSYAFGDSERFIFSGRSCSICGWKGCNICPPRQICRGGVPVPAADADGGGAGWESQLLRGDIVVNYENNHLKQQWADVVLFPATGDFFSFCPFPFFSLFRFCTMSRPA